MNSYFPQSDKPQLRWVSIIQENAYYFGITKVLCANSAKYIRRTGFTWSKLPHTLCLATNRKYIDQALDSRNIAGIISHTNLKEYVDKGTDKLFVFCDEPAELFYAIHNSAIHLPFGEPTTANSTISSSAEIANSAIIHDNVSIGNNVRVHDNVVILPGTKIGNGCEIHPGVTIGTTGFFSKTVFRKKTQIDHFGGVSIGENCIVHARSNISRSVNHQENTELAANVHLGIGVNIAHDCKIAQDTDISAGVVLAGRVNIGEHCWIGAGALVSNALTIGANSNIHIGSVVVSDLEPDSNVSGNFAESHKLRLRKHLLG